VYYEDVDGSQWIQVQANSALGASIESRLGALESQAIAYGNQNPNVTINGAFDIWQRGTSLSHSGGGVGADMWREYTDSGSGTQARDTSDYPEGLPAQSYRFTSGANSTNWSLFQVIESANSSPLLGKTVTISFYLKSSVSRTFRATFGINSTVDAGWSAAGWTTHAFQDFSVTTSWARYSFTTTVPITARTLQVGVSSNGANMASGSIIRVAGVQLEIGSTATSFRRNGNSIQEELANCQRYFIRLQSTGTVAVAYGFQNQTTSGQGVIPLPVTMRAAPSGSQSNCLWSDDVSFANGLSSFNVTTGTDTQAIRFSCGFGSGGAQFRPGQIRGNGTGTIDLSAEL
jgi:hypothetical protein